ncbi:hypothetical protein QOT17_019903 [Balamuthia mandrillaris]
MVFCVHCGTQLPDFANFCLACGQAVLKPSETAADPSSSASASASTPILPSAQPNEEQAQETRPAATSRATSPPVVPPRSSPETVSSTPSPPPSAVTALNRANLRKTASSPKLTKITASKPLPPNPAMATLRVQHSADNLPSVRNQPGPSASPSLLSSSPPARVRFPQHVFQTQQQPQPQPQPQPQAASSPLTSSSSFTSVSFSTSSSQTPPPRPPLPASFVPSSSASPPPPVAARSPPLASPFSSSGTYSTLRHPLPGLDLASLQPNHKTSSSSSSEKPSSCPSSPPPSLTSSASDISTSWPELPVSPREMDAPRSNPEILGRPVRSPVIPSARSHSHRDKSSTAPLSAHARPISPPPSLATPSSPPSSSAFTGPRSPPPRNILATSPPSFSPSAFGLAFASSNAFPVVRRALSPPPVPSRSTFSPSSSSPHPHHHHAPPTPGSSYTTDSITTATQQQELVPKAQDDSGITNRGAARTPANLFARQISLPNFGSKIKTTVSAVLIDAALSSADKEQKRKEEEEKEQRRREEEKLMLQKEDEYIKKQKMIRKGLQSPSIYMPSKRASNVLPAHSNGGRVNFRFTREQKEQTHGKKSFTLYQILVRWDDMVWTIWRRFSQISEVDSTLRRTSYSPPAKLPAKALKLKDSEAFYQQMEEYIDGLAATQDGFFNHPKALTAIQRFFAPSQMGDEKDKYLPLPFSLI